MELFSKVCRLCYKDYKTPRKQQRYCSVGCSYRGKNKKAFNSYLNDKDKAAMQANQEGLAIRRMKPESDMGGLNLDKESYSE
jgi:hypothetical protein